MAKATPDRPFTPSGFFAFRTPLLPFEELEARYKSDISETAEKVFVYCMGGERSRSACDFLSRRGYTNLYNVGDGIQAWRGAIEGDGERRLIQIQPRI